MSETFQDAMRAAGLEPPERIIPGRLYRFPGLNKKRGNTSARCKLFADGLGGWWKDYSSGIEGNWQAKREKPYTASERAKRRIQIEQAQAQQREEQEQEQIRQKEKALKAWQSASPVENHPYLTLKGIKAYGLRTDGRNLLIPLFDIHGTFQGYQWIGAAGHKGFSSGCQKKGSYFLLGEPVDGELFYIAEGYATAASTYEAKGQAVAVAFDAGNLLHVALAIHQQYPRSPIIMAADNDIHLDENTGILKAQEAAQAVNGHITYPTSPQRPSPVSGLITALRKPLPTLTIFIATR